MHQREPVILVVDDNPENLRLLMEVLEGNQYQTKLARSGELALASAGEEVPDLVLLDINMPGMDGFEVCDRLKAAEATRNVPIIFISALNQTDDKVAALNRGGVDYITKPFQVEEVLARVESHLELQALRLKLERNNASLQTRNESLATFARALAHDIRNPLSGVSSTADFWIACKGDGIDTHVSMGNIKDSADRIEGIVDGLLLLTRSEMEGFDLEPLNMFHLVKRSEQALT
ncbi:MAG: response regulator, partial [Verrucomicrobiota bacterium]